jgi:hypothetical protein
MSSSSSFSVSSSFSSRESVPESFEFSTSEEEEEEPRMEEGGLEEDEAAEVVAEDEGVKRRGGKTDCGVRRVFLDRAPTLKAVSKIESSLGSMPNRKKRKRESRWLAKRE